MLKRRVGGIKLGRKLVRVFRWAFSKRKSTTTRYRQLTHGNEHQSKNRAVSKLRKWGRTISRGAREICSINSPRSSQTTATTNNRFLNSAFSNYIRVSQGYDNEDGDESPSGGSGSWRNRRKRMIGGVPKGHLAVYVGEEEKERVLVPVIYLNHPLFEKLLKEAEEVYGFDQPGRITIPCPISEFEHVQTEIAERDYSRRWRKSNYHHHHRRDVNQYKSGLRCMTI